MGEQIITEKAIEKYEVWLRKEEKSENTILKYLHDLKGFFEWLNEKEVSKEIVIQWKEYLCSMGRSAKTINSALAALHGFFDFMGWQECRVKYLKIQRQMFRDTSRELTKGEYLHLLRAAKGNLRLTLVLETICGTGMRVSELRYITVEAVKKGRAEIWLKGKIRTILIPNKLAKKLQKYAKKEKIYSGEIFITKNGTSMSRRQVWGEMKNLSKKSGIEATKIFPHNLRHLFARSYYKVCKDIVQLADVLGHSSVETTRIYLVTTRLEHCKSLEQLGLVL